MAKSIRSIGNIVNIFHVLAFLWFSLNELKPLRCLGLWQIKIFHPCTLSGLYTENSLLALNEHNEAHICDRSIYDVYCAYRSGLEKMSFNEMSLRYFSAQDSYYVHWMKSNLARLQICCYFFVIVHHRERSFRRYGSPFAVHYLYNDLWVVLRS